MHCSGIWDLSRYMSSGRKWNDLTLKHAFFHVHKIDIIMNGNPLSDFFRNMLPAAQFSIVTPHCNEWVTTGWPVAK